MFPPPPTPLKLKLRRMPLAMYKKRGLYEMFSDQFIVFRQLDTILYWTS